MAVKSTGNGATMRTVIYVILAAFAVGGTTFGFGRGFAAKEIPKMERSIRRLDRRVDKNDTQVEVILNELKTINKTLDRIDKKLP